MTSSDCIRSTRPCMSGDCHQAATYMMYEYLGAYRWATGGHIPLVYACPEHVEQLARQHRVTAGDIVPYDDKVPL